MKMRLPIAMFLIACLPAMGQQTTGSAHGEFQVSGTLVNSVSGAVVHNAFVQLIPVAQGQQGRHVEVGTDGTFSFHNLAEGKYSLVAQARGFAAQSFEQHENFNTAIVVGPGKTSTDLVFRLRPQSSIMGKILDEHNEPIRDAQVWLFARTTDMGRHMIEARGQFQSDDRGEYHFGHLAPGTYYVAVSAQPWYHRYIAGAFRKLPAGQPQPEIDPALDAAYPITYYPGTTQSDDAGAIVLRPGDRISADFNLSAVPSLHITLHTPTADGTRPAQPNFRQHIFGEPVGFAQPNTVWGQGEMEISGIAPGDYTMNLVQFDGQTTSMKAQEVSLQQSGEMDASGASALERVHGTVKFDGSRPPSNAFLEFRNLTSGTRMGARVDEQSGFTVQPEQAGRYMIALANAPGYAIRSISATGGRVSGRTVEFAGSQPLELTIDASEGVGAITGTVLKADKPISGAMVVLVPQQIADNAPLFRRDQSDSDGTFILRDVVPGKYTAIAIQNGWDLEWGSPDVLRPYLASGIAVQINGNQKLDIKIPTQ
jgi:hypothetical protein